MRGGGENASSQQCARHPPRQEVIVGQPVGQALEQAAALAAGGDFVKTKGPTRLLELVPMFSYVTLAPFLSADAAYEAAVG